MLRQNQLADFIAALDDLHQLRVPVRPCNHVPILRSGRGQHLDRSRRAFRRITSADMLSQHSRDDHIGRCGSPALAGMLTDPGRDLLSGKEIREVTGDELMVGKQFTCLPPTSGMSSCRAQTRPQDADTPPGDGNPSIGEGGGEQQGQGLFPAADHTGHRKPYPVETDVRMPGCAAAERIRHWLYTHARSGCRHGHEGSSLVLKAENQEQIGVSRTGDPHLLAVENDRVAADPNLRFHRGEIAAGYWFAERHGGQASTGQVGEVPRPLSTIADSLDSPRGHSL